MNSIGPYSDANPSSPPARFRFYEDEEGLLQDDPIFEFDEDGEMREVTPLLPEPGMEVDSLSVARPQSIARPRMSRLASIDEEIPDFELPGTVPQTPRVCLPAIIMSNCLTAIRGRIDLPSPWRI